MVYNVEFDVAGKLVARLIRAELGGLVLDFCEGRIGRFSVGFL